MPKILRLSSASRRQAGMDRQAARGMHIVSENRINERVPKKVYTVPHENGLVRRITLFEHALKEEILEKVAEGYKAIRSRIIK